MRRVYAYITFYLYNISCNINIEHYCGYVVLLASHEGDANGTVVGYLYTMGGGGKRN